MRLHVVSWIMPHTFNIAILSKRGTKALYEFNKCLLHPPSIWQLTFTFLFPLLNYQCKVTGKKNLIRGPCSKWFGKRSSNQLSMILIWQLHCESHALFQIILILTLPWLNKLNTAFGHVPTSKMNNDIFHVQGSFSC
jgi:hypothetical protein